MAEENNNQKTENKIPESTEKKTEISEEKVSAPIKETPTNDRTSDSRKKPYNRTSKPRQDVRRMPMFRKKVCRFCKDKNISIDYKRVEVLERFITDRGKILPRRITGTCSKHQRALSLAIKRARLIALLPFVVK